MIGRVPAWLLAIGLLAGPAAGAAEISAVEVRREDGTYHLSLEARIAAPPLAVFSVLTDYEHLTRLHESIRESRVMERVNASTTKVYTEVRACVAIFCRRIRRIEQVEERPPHELHATILPGPSNVTEGEVLWRLERDGKGTRLRYESSMDPDFWIPPLFGRSMMKNALETTTREMIQNIEELAMQADVGGGEPWRERP